MGCCMNRINAIRLFRTVLIDGALPWDASSRFLLPVRLSSWQKNRHQVFRQRHYSASC